MKFIASVGTVARLVDAAGGRVGDDGPRVVGVVAVERHGEAGLALRDRALEVHHVAPHLLGALLGRKRVGRVQRLVAEPEVGVPAPAAEARLGDHLDPHHAGLVVLGRERIGVEADLLDLILRRQPAAAEAVDEDLRARPGHARELLGHLVRIVGQRVDLVLGERLREAVVAAIGGALILHDHRLFDGGQRQPQRGPVLAAPHGERRGQRTEAFGDGLDLVGARVEVDELRDAAIVHRARSARRRSNPPPSPAR